MDVKGMVGIGSNVGRRACLTGRIFARILWAERPGPLLYCAMSTFYAMTI